jgi:hypothetical protein
LAARGGYADASSTAGTRRSRNPGQLRHPGLHPDPQPAD